MTSAAATSAAAGGVLKKNQEDYGHWKWESIQQHYAALLSHWLGIRNIDI